MRLLDLFCGGGGAARGYADAGFEVVGVDINHQPNYPYEFMRGDALEVLDILTMKMPKARWRLEDFDVIHASPPCQGYSPHVSSNDSPYVVSRGRSEPRLIEDTRELLKATGKPYVMENVMGARRDLHGSLLLCGGMFDLPIRRHRIFETSHLIMSPPHDKRCRWIAKAFAAARGWEHRDMTVTGKGRRAGTSERWSEIMGIDWPMTQHALAEAIPPAYTEYIGKQLIMAVQE